MVKDEAEGCHRSKIIKSRVVIPESLYASGSQWKDFKWGQQSLWCLPTGRKKQFMERWRKDTKQFTEAKENNWEAKQATLKKKSEYANKGHLK